MNRTQALKQKTFDEQQWQKLYYRHQQQYLRQRLDAIRLLKQGQTRNQVCQQLGCTYDTLTSWRDKYLQGGLEQKRECHNPQQTIPIDNSTAATTQTDGTASTSY